MADIFTARLVTGDHIIGEIQESSESDFIFLQKALLVGMVDRGNGNIGIGFGPVSPLAPNASKGNMVRLHRNSILMQVDFDPDIVSNYRNMVSSIVIASTF